MTSSLKNRYRLLRIQMCAITRSALGHWTINFQFTFKNSPTRKPIQVQRPTQKRWDRLGGGITRRWYSFSSYSVDSDFIQIEAIILLCRNTFISRRFPLRKRTKTIWFDCHTGNSLQSFIQILSKAHEKSFLDRNPISLRLLVCQRRKCSARILELK